jgi:hypothetical protein
MQQVENILLRIIIIGGINQSGIFEIRMPKLNGTIASLLSFAQRMKTGVAG